MQSVRITLLAVASLALGAFPACGQNALPPPVPNPAPNLTQLNESGQISLNGRLTPYLIRHLPVSSFPQLPAAVQDQLNRRGCQIPQTFQAYRPENVVQAGMQHSGSSDWAVLCSADGTVSLLVFFAGNPAQSFTLASAPETERLQASHSGEALGFDWGIDAATPGQVHDAQAGLEPRPPLLDHDALADSILNRSTVYHFYAHSAWTLVDLPN
jgi:hypothetical protein